MERMFSILAVASVAFRAPCAAAAAEPKPAFPRQMSYKCTMHVSVDSHDLFAGNNFSGTHYLNADLQVMRTEWLMTCPGVTCGRFGPNPTSVGINAHGREQVVTVRVISVRPCKIAALELPWEAMYQTTVNERLPPGPGKAQAVQCHKLPLHQPVFNESWADGALYRGVHYLDGQLCHRWSNTVPWAVQRVQRISDFYSDFYTNLPVASISEDGAIDLRFFDLNLQLMPESLFDPTGLHCGECDGDCGPNLMLV
ncbi:unnamed protein product [Symbiodinium sp. CCMP2592]|nr:unnamed protein product [Symbiodinium sp. CCMP2592]